MRTQNHKWLALALLLIAIGLVACSTPSKPTAKLTPISGQINAAQEITIQVAAADAKGVNRVEFLVDNTFSGEAKVDPPQKAISVPFKWSAVAGQHTLGARAFNVDNAASDLDTLIVVVAGAPTPVPTIAPTVVPTLAPTVAPSATPVPPTPSPVACTNSVAFIADATFPDGAPVTPGQAFNKTWRVRNAGTCAWMTAYQIVRVSGERMSAADAYALPATAPGATADVTVPMTAPAAAGIHQSGWQLRDPNGALFGSLIVRVNTVVPAPPQAMIVSPGNGFAFVSGTVVRVTFSGASNYTEMSSISLYANGQLLGKTPARTPSRQLTGAVDWRPTPGNYDLYVVAVDINGQQSTSAHIAGVITPPAPVCVPSINFRADRTTINYNEHTWLRWDVECVKAVYLDGQGVTGHDARDVSPNHTTTYTLRVIKNDNSTEDRQVTIIVNPAPQPTPIPTRRNITGTWRAGDYSVELMEALGCPGPVCGIIGRMIHQIGTTTPQIVDVQGQFNVYTGAVSFAAVIPGGQSFNGTVSADSRTMSGTLGNVGALTFTKQ